MWPTAFDDPVCAGETDSKVCADEELRKIALAEAK